MGSKSISWIVIAAIIVFDLIAFGLAIGGEHNRSTAASSEVDAQAVEGDYVFCRYKSDKSSGLGAGAMIFLLLGHLVVMGVTKCLCCGCPYKPGGARFFGVFFFILLWICFVLAELLLLVASVTNTIHTKKGYFYGSEQLSCKQLRKGIFNGGAALTFLTGVFSVLYYILIKTVSTTSWDYRGGSNAANIGMSQL